MLRLLWQNSVPLWCHSHFVAEAGSETAGIETLPAEEHFDCESDAADLCAEVEKTAEVDDLERGVRQAERSWMTRRMPAVDSN